MWSGSKLQPIALQISSSWSSSEPADRKPSTVLLWTTGTVDMTTARYLVVQAGRRSAIIPLTSARNRVLPDGLLDGVAFRASTLACREEPVETISFSFRPRPTHLLPG